MVANVQQSICSNVELVLVVRSMRHGAFNVNPLSANPH